MGHTDYILRAEKICKSFNAFQAVTDVDLKIQRGTIHALIGPNGAGKTTCFNLITQFVPLSSGRIVFEGQDITGIGAASTAAMGMVRSFQISAVFGELTVRENIKLALQRKAGWGRQFWRSTAFLSALDEEALTMIDAVGLTRFTDAPAGQLSYGRKRALELATTLALDPKIVLLDEPMAGMGHEDIDRVSELIRTAARQRTVLMVEHNLKVVADLSDRITVLQNGRVLAEGNYDEVSQDARVMAAYMGVVQ